MHPPLEVDVENGDQLITAGGIVVSTHRGKERWDVDIGADDGIQDPFKAEVSDAFETFLERVDTRYGDGVVWREALAGKETEQGRFAGAIC